MAFLYVIVGCLAVALAAGLCQLLGMGLNILINKLTNFRLQFVMPLMFVGAISIILTWMLSMAMYLLGAGVLQGLGVIKGL
jgi:hypothetical protein